MPVGTVITDRETGALVADLAAHGQVALLAQGGRGGLGNVNFKSSAQPRTAPGDARRARRKPRARARAQAARRRRPARAPERRQVDADPRDLERAAEGGGLSLHDAAPEPRRGPRRHEPQLRRRRHPRTDRRRRRRRRPRAPVPAPPRAHAAAAARRRPRAVRPGRRSGPRCARDRRGAARSTTSACTANRGGSVLNKIDLLAPQSAIAR